jgi:hypothetical protein
VANDALATSPLNPGLIDRLPTVSFFEIVTPPDIWTALSRVLVNEPVVDVSAPVDVVPKVVIPALDVRPAPAVRSPLNSPVVDVNGPVPVVPRVVAPAVDVNPLPAVRSPLNVPVVELKALVEVAPRVVVAAVEVRPEEKIAILSIVTFAVVIVM